MSKRQETPIKKNAFVHKLYSMLNDEELKDLIWWTRDEESNTFALSPGKDFAKALTRYFKHGNVASFVRQLHMYGFHKVSDPSHAASAVDNDLPVWEFKHSSGKFKKNDESSLVYIKRRSSSNNSRNVYNNETDSNVVIPIPTSTPSPEHVQYVNENGQYVPQGYYFYNGHQMGRHLPHHLSFPPGSASLHQHQAVPGQMYYTQKPLPSAVPHTYSADNVLEKNKLPDVQRSISPQSQPGGQLHQIPKSHHISPAPATSQPQGKQQPQQYLQAHQQHRQLSQQLAVSQPLHPLPLNPQQDLQDYPKQGQDSQDNQQPQHYTPNLQFRKIWENNNQSSRPRNPSLLFDPLAPAPNSSHLQPLSESQGAESQSQSSFAYLMTRSDSRSSYTSARESITSGRNSFLSNRDSFASARESFALTRDSLSSAKDSFSSSRDSFILSKDSDSNKLSIKLPPLSSIHNQGTFPNNPSSPFTSLSDTNSNSLNLPNANLPSGAAISDIPTESSASTLKIKSNSIPESSSTIKRPSIFQSHSVHEKLRPSLIELHFGSSSKTSILNPQHDSIGSQSSHNSVFSNNSSISSASSFHRTSSFGSISHHPVLSNKNSISIAPHEMVPIHVLRSRGSNADEDTATVESKESTPAIQRANSTTPKANQLNSPVKRSSVLANTSAAPVPVKIRSLNSSPLSRLVVNENLMDTADSQLLKSSNTKVSINSLLEDYESLDSIDVHGVKVGPNGTNTIADLNGEKDTKKNIVSD